MNCKNCDTVLTGKFCINCGQKAEIHRITAGSVLHDFFHAFTHTDKGFLLTIKELLKRPGIVAKEFIEGRRKKYFNPLSFLVITMAVSAYLSYQSGYFESFNARQKAPSQQSSEKKQPFDINKLNKSSRIMYDANMTIVKHGKILGLVLITPLIAALSWLFFRKPKYNYAEHFVQASYLFGLSNVFRVVVFIPVFVISGLNVQMIDGVFQLVFLVYMIIAFRQFFHQNLFVTILKSILVLVLFIVFFWLLIYAYAYIKYSIVGAFAY